MHTFFNSWRYFHSRVSILALITSLLASYFRKTAYFLPITFFDFYLVLLLYQKTLKLRRINKKTKSRLRKYILKVYTIPAQEVKPRGQMICVEFYTLLHRRVAILDMFYFSLVEHLGEGRENYLPLDEYLQSKE